MPLIRSDKAPSFHLPGLDVTGLAAPSRGSREMNLWRVRLPPGAVGALHSLDREEIYLAVSGNAVATLGDERVELRPGDALVIPAGQPFSLSNPGAADFEAVGAAPVGIQACMPGGAPFSPPWTE